MDQGQQESWEHYSRLVIDLLERHDKNLDKLEKQIHNVRKETRHELELAVASLRDDLRDLKEIFDGTTDFAEGSINSLSDRVLVLEKSSITLSERVSVLYRQGADSKSYRFMVIGALLAGVISLVSSFILR